ncbi:hypothetical protein CC1G_07609 [Coprinopsis cinerea okayama7|uniref:Uncharacterized protein n=1 Tax=Coprinopsis cinerea (strain Okayama-7 / 130 / ATCC MYA-4618 / FGSC 9003) TaxID=240176 RepID=A8NUS9_COPC7|nr:hypothetical protein CC1G_07609 [Coprinopsis cinerea okayama7\|eukprot:XP_001836526.2 hypothetical protein CC1G_07609 [Coprinopsis cinerea okayama7\
MPTVTRAELKEVLGIAEGECIDQFRSRCDEAVSRYLDITITGYQQRERVERVVAKIGAQNPDLVDLNLPAHEHILKKLVLDRHAKQREKRGLTCSRSKAHTRRGANRSKRPNAVTSARRLDTRPARDHPCSEVEEASPPTPAESRSQSPEVPTSSMVTQEARSTRLPRASRHPGSQTSPATSHDSVPTHRESSSTERDHSVLQFLDTVVPSLRWLAQSFIAFGFHDEETIIGVAQQPRDTVVRIIEDFQKRYNGDPENDTKITPLQAVMLVEAFKFYRDKGRG